MIIGNRLRQIREQKSLSQGDIERKTGLLRSYISRVENGHTVPAIGTLEKMAVALEVPLYQLFYDGPNPPEVPAVPKHKKGSSEEWGASGSQAKILSKFRKLLGRIDESNVNLLLFIAQKMTIKSKS